MVETSKELAVVFVHPFWLVRDTLGDERESYLQERQRTKRLYGSYEEYSKNLKQAYDFVKEAGLRSVFILPFIRTDGELRPVGGPSFLNPLKDSIIFDWSLAYKPEGEVRSISLDNNIYCVEENLQVLERMADVLYQEGFRRTILCGELGPWEHDSLGCVGTVAKSLETKMSVNGLSGCIFPLAPYESHYIRDYNVLVKELNSFVGIARHKTVLKELRKTTQILYKESVKIEDLVASIA